MRPCPWCGETHANWPTFYMNCPQFAGSARFADPPEYDPDDAEAQRIAEVFADARAEQDRGL